MKAEEIKQSFKKFDSATQTYSSLVSQISETYKSGQKKALQVVNTTLVETYWKIGQHIVEFELKGADRATYGNKLIEALAMSKDKEAMLKSIEQEKRAFRPEDIVRDSYVLDFLKIPQPNQYTPTLSVSGFRLILIQLAKRIFLVHFVVIMFVTSSAARGLLNYA